MIKIEKGKLIVNGTLEEIEDDFLTLIMILNKNPINRND